MNNLKYKIVFTSDFKKSLKKLKKQNKDLSKLYAVIEKICNKDPLEYKYKDHKLLNDKDYIDCRECHIEPNWLLIYRYNNDELILILIDTGSHSDLFLISI